MQQDKRTNRQYSKIHPYHHEMLMMGNMHNSLAITIDIEDWYHIPSVVGSPFSVYKDVEVFFKNWNERYDYLTEPTHRILSLLRAYNIRATFFVVADVANHYPNLIESIVEAGHEIACHGLDHRCTIDPETKKPLMDQKTFENQTQLAKKTLEKIAGMPVIGYRAPNALIAGWMIDSLEAIGFKYDSSVSVNSFYNKTDSSLRGVSTRPYYPKQKSLLPGQRRGLIEFPWAYYAMSGLKLPTSGGPMLRFLSAEILYKGLQQSLKRGHTIFYFHPIDVSYENFPSIGNGRPFYWLIKGKIVEKRIRYILNKATRSSVPVPINTLRNIFEEGNL